jgi:hypothetical protein
VTQAFPSTRDRRTAAPTRMRHAQAVRGARDEAGSPTRALPLRGAVATFGLVSAVSAIAGGGELIIWPRGNAYLPPLQLLEHTPFESFLVPGLLLACVVGGTSLACATLAWRRSRAAIDALILAGGALLVWIIAELAMIRAFHWLHAAYGALGFALLGLGVRAAWRSPVPRHRWLIGVTAAEASGFLIPMSAGILGAKAGLGVLPQLMVLLAGGLAEGIALGAGQAWAFPFLVRRLSYVLLTALGTGVAWLSIMSTIPLVASPDVPFVLAAGAWFLAASFGIIAIGSAQWIELRHRSRRARRWIAWSSLGWAAALPLSFTPAPFVDASTPIASQLALWGCAGLLMAYMMALITWQGVRRL